MNNSSPRKGNDLNVQQKCKPRVKCERSHEGECLLCTNAYFGCCKIVNMVRDCPQVINNTKENAKPRPNANSTIEPSKRKRFYVLKDIEEQEKPTNIVKGMLHVFTFPMYALLYLGSTLLFVTPVITSRFDVFPEILHEPILVSTPIGDYIRAE